LATTQDLDVNKQLTASGAVSVGAEPLVVSTDELPGPWVWPTADRQLRVVATRPVHARRQLL